jgi:adenylate cyclase
MEIEGGAELARRINRRLTMAASLGNAGGVAMVFAFLAFLFPASRESGTGYETLLLTSAIGTALYLPTTLYLGWRWAVRRFEPVFQWLSGEREADEVVRRVVLDHPMWSARVSALFWGLGAVGFWLLGLITASLVIGESIFFTVALGGITTSSVVYLLAERILRPVVGLALEGGQPPPKVTIPGIASRMTMAWTLATGVPLVGVVALGVTDLSGANVDQDLLVGATLFLASLALAVGFLAIFFAARGVADPIGAVRHGLVRIERGDLEASVPVDDGSEVGLLQVGFNRMAGGLRERERLREAFGAFVDPELTERVLEHGIDLAGEEVELSVMFIDVRDFTALSERSEAHDVVARLNELYGVVVPVVLKHGGHANKFIGDGLLSVFGAPERLPDHAQRAVDAALEIARAVEERFAGELRIGIGVNSGPVVAGTIGGGGRLDFTVIGDTVNTAARVEAATRKTGDDVLVTESTYRLLDGTGTWEARPPVSLKGKAREVALYAPEGALLR